MMNQHVISVFTLPCEGKYLSSINLIVARMHVHVRLINFNIPRVKFAFLPFLALMDVDENESKTLRFSINITQTCRRLAFGNVKLSENNEEK
jgi:hypothetical protein